ncbi:MAG TPA: phosphoribosylamine--glycine ligase [Candidatus Acidoferrales bacterium]|nr:phosphoribosylamine--glycine ligase [Candidatus Acidoferrales bacterium]
MHVLVIGSGGREHALAWKLKQSPRVTKLTCAPGNAGMAALGDCVAVDTKDVVAITALAEKLKADLTVIGPEAPLVAGMADEFARRGLAVVGPSKAVAELEGSKVFAKQFMQRHGIPTSGFTVCADHGDAYSALCAVEWPVVIKADGLAAGKGVRIADTPDDATAIVEAFMEKRELGEAGDTIVLEEYLEGEELSFIILTDGQSYVPLAPTRDHKRIFDDDHGPNTGGMGAYSDDGILDAALRQRILREIVEPTLRGLEADGRRYQGFLYFGLMLTADGPKVLEFNCRMGDPECQPLMLRLESDLAEVLEKVATGKLAGTELRWSTEAAACVVLASGGYPGKYETGKPITGIEEAEKLGAAVFHAGTKRAGKELVTAGGRVLGVTARGADLRSAVERAYAAVEKIRFEGMHCRRDIGARALQKTGT